jgi:DNA invertase Pin-like site-specific DNA recombinase
MADARAKRCDVICVVKFDRFARSTKHLFNSLDEFNRLNIAFVSHAENVDTTSAYGRAVFGILAVVAALERELTGERLRDKWAYIKKTENRSPGPQARRFTITNVQIERRRKKGESLRQIAASVGCSAMLLSRRLKSQ